MRRKTLVQQGMRAASEVRDRLNFDQFAPIDPYKAAEVLGIKVLFVGANMEGFYVNQQPPRILLSALRPVPRRAFTCAHELGHHTFGHGSTLDELQSDDRKDSDIPEEVLANAFAAFFLMPSVGIRGAFARRGWKMHAVTPLQLFTVACEFGVGYRTLLNHCSFGIREIGDSHRDELALWTPQRIRRNVVEGEYDSLTVVDKHNESRSFEVEKGGAILFPRQAQIEGNAVTKVGSHGNCVLYLATRRGRAIVSGVGARHEVRVMPKAYEGAASYRFMEDPDED